MDLGIGRHSFSRGNLRDLTVCYNQQFQDLGTVSTGSPRDRPPANTTSGSCGEWLRRDFIANCLETNRRAVHGKGFGASYLSKELGGWPSTRCGVGLPSAGGASVGML